MSNPRRELLGRILASRHFAAAQSLKRIVEYLFERSEKPGSRQPKEVEVAIEALGRPASFDPRLDAIVRVSIASVRERLRAYFEDEGEKEPLRVEIPKGRYRLDFTDRAAATRRTLKAEAAPGPGLSRFWGSHGEGPGETLIVVSELLFLRDESGSFVRNIYANDPTTIERVLQERELSLDVSGWTPSYHFVSAGEMSCVLDVSRVLNGLGLAFDVRKTRFCSWNALRGTNLVLLGGSRTNSFLDALQGEDDLVVTDESILNRARRRGEKERYVGRRAMDGHLERVSEYALVTRRPGLAPGSCVTTIASNHGRAIEGAGDFLTSERDVSQLLDRLGFDPHSRLPLHFQVLLRADLVDYDEEIAEVSYLAHRVYDA